MIFSHNSAYKLAFQYVSTDLGVNSEKLHHFTVKIDYGLEVVLKLAKTEYLCT